MTHAVRIMMMNSLMAPVKGKLDLTSAWNMATTGKPRLKVSFGALAEVNRRFFVPTLLAACSNFDLKGATSAEAKVLGAGRASRDMNISRMALSEDIHAVVIMIMSLMMAPVSRKSSLGSA